MLLVDNINSKAIPSVGIHACFSEETGGTGLADIFNVGLLIVFQETWRHFFGDGGVLTDVGIYKKI